MKRKLVGWIMCIMLFISVLPNLAVSAGESWWWPCPSALSYSSGYGMRTYNGVTRFHRGVDIPGTRGSQVIASRSGIARIANTNNPFANDRGRCVVIDHEDGYYSVYQHMSDYAINDNVRVMQGQVIGYVGGSGSGGEYTYNAHLHFEVHKYSPNNALTILNLDWSQGVNTPVTSTDPKAFINPNAPRPSGEAPSNITIKANKTSIEVGDTVTFTYTISNANSRYVGIDWAGGSRYYSIPLSNSSGTVSYTFTLPGTYCVITEGSNEYGYNCCGGIYITVKAKEITASISANYTSIGVGDTVTFDYYINNATSYRGLGIDYAGGSRYFSQSLDQTSGSVSHTFTKPGLYCCIVEGYNTDVYNCSPGVYVKVVDSKPIDMTISVDETNINIGDTVTFKYAIIGATVKHIGIDYADGTRYNSIRTYQDSGSISYTFTQTGLYCCIIEGYNNIGYDCSPGIYIRVTEPYQSPTTFTTYTDNDSYRRFHTEITNLTCDAEYIVASYDSGGQLLEMSNSGISAGEGGCEMTLPKHSGEKYIKVFLWDSLKGMKPLTEVEKITL